jgi:hypothetical protein
MKTKFTIYLITILSITLIISGLTVVQTQANTVVVKRLNAPYINQCLNEDKKTWYPTLMGSNNRVVCRNMCLTAAMVMITGYFGKVSYTNTDSLKKYLIEDSDIPERVKDGPSSVGGAFALTSYTGADGNNSDNYINGAIDYALRKGLVTDGVRWIPSNPEQAKTYIYQQAKAAIDRNNVMLISTPTHARVIIGYTNDGQVIVHDSYRNTEVGKAGDNFNYNGNGATYDLPTSGTSRPNNPVEQFQYIIEFGNGDKEFYKNGGGIPPQANIIPQSRIGSNVMVKNPNPQNNWDSINMRQDIAGPVVREVTFNTRGKIVSKPLYAKGYYREKIILDNGQEGWIATNFLSSGVDNNYIPVDKTVVTQESLNVRIDPSLKGYVIKTQAQGTKGKTIYKTSTVIDGYIWYLVQWDNGIRGWSVQNYLQM